ncbi:ABC transporter substrate-binding protein [Paeniglutamicibacter gangotriensis]|uniref:ABC transporter substrate-binding protein n=1 Tax=Paeniglutamicibacter gangotriensis TaxID=254787 RepID=A0A5B0E946_9MICC|nr:zinc ABC transporter substrate-binding protein [Paeniglutamicibacter gangotriensis]KAA0975146.1 ABC transporter substrate-binding protein [Paeniglutamicibacter gangotriensis]
MNRRTRILLPLALAGSLALAACGGNDTGQEPADSDKLRVATSTTVYADLVQQIGGDTIEVSPVIDSPAQDPHSYEATSRDKLSLSKAQLVVANGGGYDAFMDVLAQDLELPDSAVINAVDTSPVAHEDEGEHEGHERAESEHEGHNRAEAEHEGHDHEDGHTGEAEGADAHAGHDHAAYNEHIWYDLESIRLLTDEIATRLGTLRPVDAESYKNNAAALNDELRGLESRVAALQGPLESTAFAMTEPVPFHLLEDAGMTDATPEGLSESIEGGGEISPQALNEMEKLFSNDAIDVLAYNTQTESPQTERVRALAEAAQVPVIDFTETLPANTTYVSWMDTNIRALEALTS